MEFDADRHQARLAGSDAFAPAFERMEVLAMAMRGAYADLRGMWEERSLSDNVPALMMANVPQIPALVLEEVLKEALERRTGWLDTHPANQERIENAQREAAPGVFRSIAAKALSRHRRVCRTRRRFITSGDWG